MTDDAVVPQDSDDENDSAVDAPQIRKRALSVKQRLREAEDFWVGVFSSEVGRREIWGILSEAHAFEERMACGPNGFPQPEATWLEAGKQAFGLQLYFSWLKLARDGVNRMHDENDRRFTVSKKRNG